MKFLRLTSQDEDAIFNADFNDGIHIPPNSKIALQSASANVRGGSIAIKDSNNTITYQIEDGFQKNFQLSNFNYDKGNVLSLLVDIQRQFNKNAKFETGLNKILGLGWEATNDNTGRVELGYRIGTANAYGEVSEPTYTWTANKVGLSDIGTAEEDYEVFLTDPADAGLNYDNALVNRHPVARGVGYVRARIKTLADSGVDANNGFYMGLTLEPVDAEDFEERNLDFAIRATIVGGVAKFFSVSDGVATEVIGFSPNVGDTLEVVKDGPSIKLHQYLAGNAVPNILATLSLSTIKFDYYPCFVMNGTRTNASVNHMNWTPDMWSNVWEPNEYLKVIPYKPIARDTAVPSNSTPIPLSNNFIQFSNSVATFLVLILLEIHLLELKMLDKLYF